MGSVCGTTYKGGGVSGLTPPAGTAFEGVVAHETGHQFSARHTFSGTVGGCTPSNPTTGWEPGSGSTIMSYAGSCGTDDVDGYHLAINNYFHGGSIEQMAGYITSSGTCATSASTGNTAPTVTAPVSKSIPANTPFKLTATGSDANGDALTYNWEQMDVGSGTLVTPTTTQTVNSTLPLFRSWPSTADPTRYFPRLSDLRANTTVAGEVLPKVARSLKFRCTARDQHFSSALGRVVGGINQSSTLTLTVVNTGAAFAVTAPTTTGVSWTVGGTATVTWNVAGTTANGINCASVSLLLSTDGGATYPITLSATTANDGSETITVPGIASSQARVMVAGVGNYFFDISDQNFTIAPAPGAATTVTGFSPASGSAGTVVTVTGTNFTGATSVTFNGTPATSYTVNSATQITATVPALASTGPIAVTTTPGGTGTSAASFTVVLPNDLCTAPNLPMLYCGVPVQGTTKGATATGDPTGTCGTTINTGGGIFYRFTGPGGPVTIATCGGITNYDSKLFVFTGACGALTCVGGNDDGCSTASSVSFTSVAGTDYTIMVSGYNANQGTFTLSATCGANPPAVTSFTPTTGPAGTSVTITGTGFTGATSVKFNTSVATTYTVGSATSITATVPAGATTGPISVTTSGGTGTSATAFTVTVPPANDLCTAASLPVLTCGGTVTGTTVNSTSTGDPTATCTTTITPASGGVFYLFNGTGGSVTLSTCSAATDYDTKLFVFTGPCGSYTCVAGNDDDSGCAASGLRSTVTFPAVAGTTYYVFVSGYNGARGNFTLSATCAPPAIATSPSASAKGLLMANPAKPLEMALYPNPATGWVDVQIANLPAPTTSLELLDGLGRVVSSLTASEGHNRLSLKGLTPGLYVVRIGSKLERLLVE